MSSEEFRRLLTGAVSGDMDCVDLILRLYMPMIEKHCYINGSLDEDMRQDIMIHIVKNISKFVIR